MAQLWYANFRAGHARINENLAFTSLKTEKLELCAERQKADFLALQTANRFGEAPTVTAAD